LLDHLTTFSTGRRIRHSIVASVRLRHHFTSVRLRLRARLRSGFGTWLRCRFKRRFRLYFHHRFGIVRCRLTRLWLCLFPCITGG
jgi:hypothetical protein